MWSVKKIWFQLHWFIGITAGTMLVVIGLTGAVFSFHEEILDWLDPGIASSMPQSSKALTPPELLEAIQASGETRHIERMALYSQPGRNPQVTFAPPPGERRGEPAFVNAYTGQVLPAQKGTAFFAWVERLHRWLLLPIDTGKPIAGGLAICLLFLSLTGLYLRWPSKPLSLRTWLAFNTRRKGRPFLWSLHSVAGTWALLVYLMLASTGVYWSFTSVRTLVDGWAGIPPRAAAKAQGPSPEKSRANSLSPEALKLPWHGFEQAADAWQFVQLQLPKREGQAYQFSWYGSDAAHDRARNQLFVQADGTVQRSELFSDLPAGRRAVAAIYPLHLGSYFGLPGRIIVTLASLAMALFAITGWMLYLDRRRKARSLACEGAELRSPAAHGEGAATIAVIHASQSGHAQRLALRTASLLRGVGHAVDVQAIAQLDLHALAKYRYVLWVASTFGDGGPPDVARGFFSALQREDQPLLQQQRYGVLALGDRQYDDFCGFGLRLQEQLQSTGAKPLFPAVTMDGESADAWQTWRSELNHYWQIADVPVSEVAESETAFTDWQLVRRLHTNPGSQGNPLYLLELAPLSGNASWEAGALVEVLAQNSPKRVQAWLDANQHAGSEQVVFDDQAMSLRSALSICVLPQPEKALRDPQLLAQQLQPIAPRSYSIASLPCDGCIQLLVRQSIRDGELGLASGWLTEHLLLEGRVKLRLVANPGFLPALQHGQPAIFIGNGSGYAGLRTQLLARMRNAQYDNWFIFGERQCSVDGWAETEINAWMSEGKLARADFAYSRDSSEMRYAQHIVRREASVLRDWIGRGAILFICGSYQGMASDVEQALIELLGEETLSQLAASKRYRRDVY